MQIMVSSFNATQPKYALDFFILVRYCQLPMKVFPYKSSLSLSQDDSFKPLLSKPPIAIKAPPA